MSECGINFNEYEWARARANTSKFNNCERTQTRTRAKFNESGSEQNLIKTIDMSKNLIDEPYLRQVAPAAELNFISTYRTAKFYFISAVGLNFISDPSQD
ncbi:hypothetical protein [uncultured Campylobacter sp.]|uniref:hypothetical protein n=1 Tax=uncultured Campylobacter sp. TaxID=218934 RepID=UPI002636E11B|nr:hypothetical protein [uncultured Campylobacter sp.]